MLTNDRTHRRNRSANDWRGFHRLLMGGLRILESARDQSILLEISTRFPMLAMSHVDLRHDVFPRITTILGRD